LTQKVSSILFICLGNICRSPLAEGVFRNEAEKRGIVDLITIDSAGTGGWHIGNPPDPRSIETAANHDIDINHQVCRRLTSRDFSTFDLILGMDNSNIINATSADSANGPAQILLFTQYAGMGDDLEIADPYYGGVEGFETVYQLIKQASRGTLNRLFTA
jgi:protein-tyrosine phosphatase